MILLALLLFEDLICWNDRYISGADPGFQVRGGAHFKKLTRAEGGAKFLGYFV